MADENRPYRVGMARVGQRYIEPDAIYLDMQRGDRARIPREFPYTWNPVNGFSGTGLGRVPGFGATDTLTAQSSNPVNDLLNVINQVASSGGAAAGDASKTALLNALNNTPAGRALLQTIEAKAADGVGTLFKKQAPNLLLLAIAGGAIGGVAAQKLGKAGTVGAIGLAIFAVFNIFNAATAPK